MSQYLQEDNVSTQASLQGAQNIKDRSKNEMQDFEKTNQEELAQMEELVM